MASVEKRDIHEQKTAVASTAHLEWEASPPEQGVWFYNIYKVSPRASRIAPTWDIIGVTTGTEFVTDPFPSGSRQVFGVSAVNAYGESPKSIVIWRAP